MNKKQITIILTTLTIIAWSMTLLLGNINMSSDSLQIVFMHMIPTTTALCVCWWSKLLMEKVKKTNIHYSMVTMVFSMIILIPTLAVAIYDIKCSVGFLAGLVGFVLLLYIGIPMSIMLVVSIIVNIRWRKTHGKTDTYDKSKERDI